MKNIRHIFFDLDNTLWDQRKNAYFTLKKIFSDKKISENYDIDFEMFYKTYFEINEKLWEQIRDGEIDKEHLRKTRFRESFLKFNIDDKIISNYFENHFLDEILKFNNLLPYTKHILDYLKSKGYKMHILSNGFQEVTQRKCVMSGIFNYFETITSADIIDIRKPRPEIYQYSLDLAKAKKSESIMIGDDLIADIIGAQSFGMDAIFFDVFCDNPKKENLKIIKNLMEIKDHL